MKLSELFTNMNELNLTLVCAIQEISSPHSKRQPPVEGSSCLIVHGNILQLLGTASDDRKYPD